MSTRIRRDVLLRKARAGRLLARTELSYSDDYRHDVHPDKNRKFIPARVNEHGDSYDHPGKFILWESDFKTKSGYASKNDDGSYSLCVHSNLYIELREAA